ncbi:MAG: DUF177 domain-containing protein [Candidatus Omnitrophota bacterium]
MPSKILLKIDLNRLPAEGLVLEENINASDLDTDSEFIKANGPIKVRAEVSRITNAVTVALEMNAALKMRCGRCLEDFEAPLKKGVVLNYFVESSQRAIDLTPDVREEFLLAYPMNPLCSPGCKGLCPKCGQNLNKQKCAC